MKTITSFLELEEWAARASRPGDKCLYYTREPNKAMGCPDGRFDLARRLVALGAFMSFKCFRGDHWEWILVRISRETGFRLDSIMTRMQRKYPPPKRRHGGGYEKAPRSWRL